MVDRFQASLTRIPSYPMTESEDPVLRMAFKTPMAISSQKQNTPSHSPASMICMAISYPDFSVMIAWYCKGETESAVSMVAAKPAYRSLSVCACVGP